MTSLRPPAPGDLADALRAVAAAVALVTVADGRDDVGVTVSTLCPVSADPPLVSVALQAARTPRSCSAGWTGSR